MLDEVGELQALLGEGAVGIVRGEAARVRGRPARIEVDPDEDIRPRQVRADVAGRDVVVRADEGEEPSVDVGRRQAQHRRLGGPRHDHAVAVGSEQCHCVELHREREGRLGDRRPRGRAPDATGVDAAVPGVEEDREVPVPGGRRERLARAGGEVRGIEGLPSVPTIGDGALGDDRNRSRSEDQDQEQDHGHLRPAPPTRSAARSRPRQGAAQSEA